MALLHANHARVIVPHWLVLESCPFDNSELETEEIEIKTERHQYINRKVCKCSTCGWWKIVDSDEKSTIQNLDPILLHAAMGSLYEFDLKDINTPIQEVRSFLLKQYERRFDLNPKLFEEVVASVFRDFGYTSQLTQYSADGGVDIILRDRDDQAVAVQVKRYKNKIKTEQIRSFAGALLLRGHTKGIFVTTSSFSNEAVANTMLLNKRGIQIELIDAERFFSALDIQKIKSEDLKLSDIATQEPSLQNLPQWIGNITLNTKTFPQKNVFYPPWSSPIPECVEELGNLNHYDQEWWTWLRLFAVDYEINEKEIIAKSFINRIAKHFSLKIDAAISLLHELTLLNNPLSEIAFFTKDESGNISEKSHPDISLRYRETKNNNRNREDAKWMENIAVAWKLLPGWKALLQGWGEHE